MIDPLECSTDRLLNSLHKLFKMPMPRELKCRTLFRLAQEAREPGCIVELGTFHANGAISLYWGTACGENLQVYSVDDYTEKKGWSGEPYGPEDRNIAVANLRAVGANWTAMGGVILLGLDAQAAAQKWHPKNPIALLFWDLGCQNRVEEDLALWLPLVRERGVIAVHDTATGRLGAEQALTELELPFALEPGGVLVAQKQ